MEKINPAVIKKNYDSYNLTKERVRYLLKKGEIGKVTGVIGPFVLRYNKGKQIISNRPVDFHMSMTKTTVEGRNNFAAKVKFARVLISDPLIKRIWADAEIAGRNSWNRLIRHNNISGSHPDKRNIITPSKYHFEIDKICSFGSDYSIRSIENSYLKQDDRIYVVIVPFNPITLKQAPFEIISVSGFAGELQLNETQKNICSKYRSYVLYSAAVRQSGKDLEWSNTTAHEGFFENQAEKTIDYCEDNSFYLIVLDPDLINTNEDVHKRIKRNTYYFLRL